MGGHHCSVDLRCAAGLAVTTRWGGPRWPLQLGAVAWAAGWLAACSGPDSQLAAPTVRQQLEQQVDLARKGPLDLRWNPAPCACPPFEVRTAEGWLRAELQASETEKIQQWTAFLSATPLEALPVPVAVQGRLERGIYRLTNGNFACRVEVTEVIGPLPPPPPPPTPVDGGQPAP